MSRVGKKPISIPKEVKVIISGQTIEANGPLSALSYTVPSWITIQRESDVLSLLCDKLTQEKKAQYGMVRAMVNNVVAGVLKPFVKQLEIRGIGFKAQVQGTTLQLQVGYTHPCILPIPQGLKVSVDENTKISVSGADKYIVGEFAHKIRSMRVPEPYKGTGIRYVNEYVRKKVGKTGVAGGAGAGGK